MTVKDALFSYQDLKYRDFQSPLVPNIDKETIIGVRTPQMRQVAKDFFGKKEGDAFLKKLPHRYYEENLVHFFMISFAPKPSFRPRLCCSKHSKG